MDICMVEIRIRFIFDDMTDMVAICHFISGFFCCANGQSLDCAPMRLVGYSELLF